MTRFARLATLGVLGLGLSGWGWLAAFKPETLPGVLRIAALESNAKAVTAPAGSVTTGSTDRSAAAAPGRHRPTGPIAVEAASARQARTSSDIRAVGSLQSDETVQIASEIAGRIAEIPFKEGQPVKAGDVIVKLDDALVKAEVTDTNARLKLAQQNDERTRTLVQRGAATVKTRDEAVSSLDIATAAAELARTRLDKHTLRAPFAGIAGVRRVSVGAYVAVGSPIVNIEKLDTLKVDFKVPELFLTGIKVGQPIEVAIDAVPGRVFMGEIYAINPMIDVNGRALEVRARLDNPDMILRPGLFARITIKSLAEREVTLVPESAVVPRGGDAFVFRVENGQAVESRVKLGERKDAEVEILEGLAPTATVITAGQQKVRNGSNVEVVSAKPDDAPRTSISPAAKAGGSG